MRSLLYLLRVGIFFFGGYALFHVGPVIGIFIFATGLFSFLFKIRGPLSITPSPYADLWELGGTIILFVNSFILSILDYNSLAYAWMDIPMHIAGGMFAAFWALLAFENDSVRWPAIKSIAMILGVTAFIGVGWEFFEWTFDHTLGNRYHLPPAQASLKDTMGDLLSNLIGSLFVIAFSIKQNAKNITKPLSLFS